MSKGLKQEVEDVLRELCILHYEDVSTDDQPNYQVAFGEVEDSVKILMRGLERVVHFEPSIMVLNGSKALPLSFANRSKLRDEFAMQAMQGFVSGNDPQLRDMDVAKLAYRVADNMLKEREK